MSADVRAEARHCTADLAARAGTRLRAGDWHAPADVRASVKTRVQAILSGPRDLARRSPR